MTQQCGQMEIGMSEILSESLHLGSGRVTSKASALNGTGIISVEPGLAQEMGLNKESTNTAEQSWKIGRM